MHIGTYIIGDEILSGKRRDKHLAAVQERLARRGLRLSWAHYLGDERDLLARAFAASLARGDLVFCFGGIGATPDDHTRQAAASALGVALVRHPDAVALLEAQYGEQTYPVRVAMAELPEGARLIPNPVNRVAGFSVRDHHFLPGFPQMAWPMMEWVLAERYPDLRAPHPMGERAIVVHEAPESVLVPLMSENVARFPDLKLFSLPTLLPDGARRIELGVRGSVEELEAALAHLREGVSALGFRWEPIAPRDDA